MGYTIELNLKDRPCLVVGGGKVAKRKILKLLKSKAQITVIAPKIIPAIEKLPIIIKKTPFQKEFLEGVFLVVCATDSIVVNTYVAENAKKRGILLNMAAPPLHMSDFFVPASAEKDDLKITISTNGKSPELAKILRKKIENEMLLPYAKFLKTLTLLRQEGKHIFSTSKERENFWQQTLTKDILTLIERNKIKQAEEEITHALNGYRS